MKGPFANQGYGSALITLSPSHDGLLQMLIYTLNPMFQSVAASIAIVPIVQIFPIKFCNTFFVMAFG